MTVSNQSRDIRVPPYMCPECMKDDEEENYRKYSLKLNVPKAEEMWDKDKNAIPLEDAKTYMSESAHFICDEGHNFPRTIRSFVKNQNCPVCSLDSIVKYPHLVRQWDFKKNKDHDINLISANSKDDVYWRCKKCGYGWKAQIFTRKKSKGRCPCCEERTVIVKGITDLFTLVPGLEESYDYDANVGIDPYTLSVTSNTPIHWKCPDCGNRWVSAPLSRVEKDGDSYRDRKCPACAGVMRTKSYGEEYPELVSKFADDVNECTLYDIILHNDAKETYFGIVISVARNFRLLSLLWSGHLTQRVMVVHIVLVKRFFVRTASQRDIQKLWMNMIRKTKSIPLQ